MCRGKGRQVEEGSYLIQQERNRMEHFDGNGSFSFLPQNVSSLVFTGITQERTHEAGGLDQSAAHKLGDDLSS